MIFRFMLNKSQRGLDKMMLRTPVTPPMVTDWRHLIVSRSIFSASSILYFRAMRKRRIVAFRLPHGHSSSGISTPSDPKREKSSFTNSFQLFGCGYSWKTLLRKNSCHKPAKLQNGEGWMENGDGWIIYMIAKRIDALDVEIWRHTLQEAPKGRLPLRTSSWTFLPMATSRRGKASMRDRFSPRPVNPNVALVRAGDKSSAISSSVTIRVTCIVVNWLEHMQNFY